MSTPKEVQEPKSKVPPMPPTLADRELAEAICRELFPEFCTGLSDDLCEFANRATVVSKHIAAHCAAATAKERQARELAEERLRATVEQMARERDDILGLLHLATSQAPAKESEELKVKLAEFNAKFSKGALPYMYSDPQRNLAPAPAGGKAE
jgi:hypothetical protein